MNTDIPSGAPMGTGSLADAEGMVLVLQARALRRRLRLLARVLKGLLLVGLCAPCASLPPLNWKRRMGGSSGWRTQGGRPSRVAPRHVWETASANRPRVRVMSDARWPPPGS